MASDPVRTYPSDLPVLALRQTVVFPLTLQPLAITRPISVDSVNRALSGDRLLFLVLQNDEKDDPDAADLRPIGTIGAVRQMAKMPNGGVHVIADGRGVAAARQLRADARNRCVRPAPAGAHRSRVVAGERPVAGAAGA